MPERTYSILIRLQLSNFGFQKIRGYIYLPGCLESYFSFGNDV